MNTNTSTNTTKGKGHRRRRLVLIGEVECEPDCPICLETSTAWATLKCGHKMCTSCLLQHARNNNKCPLCRAEFTPEPLQASQAPEMPSDMIDYLSQLSPNDSREEQEDQLLKALRVLERKPKKKSDDDFRPRILEQLLMDCMKSGVERANQWHAEQRS